MSLFEQYKGTETRKSSGSTQAASKGSLDRYAYNTQLAQAKPLAKKPGLDVPAKQTGHTKATVGGGSAALRKAGAAAITRSNNKQPAKKRSPKGSKRLTAKSKQKQVDPAVLERDMKVLRDFDLNPDFGPCVGITRVERWERAQSFDLDPPQIVKALLDQHPDNSDYQQQLWWRDI